MSSQKTPRLARTTPAYVQPSKKLQRQYLFLTFCFSIIFKMKVCPWMPPLPACTPPHSPALPSRSVGTVLGGGGGRTCPHCLVTTSPRLSDLAPPGPTQCRPLITAGSSSAPHPHRRGDSAVAPPHADPRGPGSGSALASSQPPAPGNCPPLRLTTFANMGDVLTDGRPITKD